MYRVMLVDDSEVMLKEIENLKVWQKSTNFMVSAKARNGYEALLKLAANPVDLVITDIMMPKVNGLELLQEIREQRLAKVVVILSGYQEFSYARQAIIFGAFDYLGKPVVEVDLEQLLNRVASYLKKISAKSKQLQQLEAQAARNIDDSYIAFGTRKLAEYVVTGNLQVENMARKSVAVLSETLDLLKMVIVIQKATAEIVTAVERCYPWLDHFIDFRHVRGINYAENRGVDQLAQAFSSLLVALVLKIDKLKPQSRNNIIVERVCSYVLEHIDHDLTIKNLAEALFLHRSYLSEVFKQQTGIRLNEYVRSVKLERAKKLIADGQLLNYQIAGQLGFKDVEYFSRLFKKYTGILPSEYQETLFTFL